MTERFTYSRIADLPNTIPVFPLPGVLLLPGGKLPLNIFEPRYLEMTRDAMASHRLIGMIQPIDPNEPPGNPALYRTGCAGQITACTETEDARFLLTLTGVVRFDIAREQPMAGKRYRRVETDWQSYATDLGTEPPFNLDRGRLLPALRQYFQLRGLTANWEAIERTPDRHLMVCLSMICPFQPNEKQALLECGKADERAALLIALLEMAAHEPAGEAASPALRQ
jgi:hypothetical protein